MAERLRELLGVPQHAWLGDVQFDMNQGNIGIGSDGVVYEIDFQGSPAAVKVLHEALIRPGNHGRDEFLRRFGSECVELKNLTHPRIVQFLGAGRAPNGSPCLLMERMKGSVAECMMRGDSGEDFECTVTVLRDVAAGLMYLHWKRIIHRDLKPQNVLLGTDGHAKIADVGLARLINEEFSQSIPTRCPGTRFYMPPEALDEGSAYGLEVDMFSFGVLANSMVTRKEPQPSEARHERLPGGGKHPIPETERRDGDLSLLPAEHPLRLLILSCLNDDPSRRPTAEQAHTTISVCLKQYSAIQKASAAAAKRAVDSAAQPEENADDPVVHSGASIQRALSTMQEQIASLADVTRQNSMLIAQAIAQQSQHDTKISSVHGDVEQLRRSVADSQEAADAHRSRADQQLVRTNESVQQVLVQQKQALAHVSAQLSELKAGHEAVVNEMVGVTATVQESMANWEVDNKNLACTLSVVRQEQDKQSQLLRRQPQHQPHVRDVSQHARVHQADGTAPSQQQQPAEVGTDVVRNATVAVPSSSSSSSRVHQSLPPAADTTSAGGSSAALRGHQEPAGLSQVSCIAGIAGMAERSPQSSQLSPVTRMTTAISETFARDVLAQREWIQRRSMSGRRLPRRCRWLIAERNKQVYLCATGSEQSVLISTAADLGELTSLAVPANTIISAMASNRENVFAVARQRDGTHALFRVDDVERELTMVCKCPYSLHSPLVLATHDEIVVFDQSLEQRVVDGAVRCRYRHLYSMSSGKWSSGCSHPHSDDAGWLDPSRLVVGLARMATFSYDDDAALSRWPLLPDIVHDARVVSCTDGQVHVFGLRLGRSSAPSDPIMHFVLDPTASVSGWVKFDTHTVKHSEQIVPLGDGVIFAADLRRRQATTRLHFGTGNAFSEPDVVPLQQPAGLVDGKSTCVAAAAVCGALLVVAAEKIHSNTDYKLFTMSLKP
ncbi:TRAF2 and NCK-interacting protein kinase-like [Sycon ciliatum]|uniref:TRAF2 and NCK-interacting protein kinase-like n=1 Tax=Sycon ciliatum TaxID=27933 RepID=UPI0031F6EADF